MGGLFVNYFNRFGRQWQVYIEAEGEYRTKAENVGQFYVRNNKGEMVPLSALTKFESRAGPNSPCATTCTGPLSSTAPPRRATVPHRL